MPFDMKNFFLFLLLITTFIFCNAQNHSNAFTSYPPAGPGQNSLMAKWEKKHIVDSCLFSLPGI